MQIKKITLAVSVAAAMGFVATAQAADFDSPAIQRALSHLNGGPSLMGNASEQAREEQWHARDVIVDRDGTEHVRFDRSYKGLRVIGGDVVVHSNRGQLKSMSLTTPRAMKLDTKVAFDDQYAISIAESQFAGTRSGSSKAELVVYSRGNRPQMAYLVEIEGVKADQTPTEMNFVVDATSGQVVDKWDHVHTAASAGTGKSLYSGAVGLTTDSQTSGFALRDPNRGSHYVNNMANKTSGTGTLMTDTDNIWGDGTTSSNQSAAADVQYGQNMAWDYYKNVHGRNGIANDGRGGYSKVHYGRNYVNAFWSDSCFCMTYGDGDGVTYMPLVNLDVAGHEMSHGITSRSANLTYSGESGGLNEATSDIFGTLIEFYANNAKDPGDYLIGEKIYKSNPNGTKALRFMFKPFLDGASPDCYSSTLGSKDVHYSSGVANHFFYLLAEGAVVPAGFGSGTSANLTSSSLVCNGNTALTGIGRDAAGKIWYRALTVYMTSSTNYAGARAATLSAATDLYGATSTQRAAVAAAWSAVSVN